MRAAALTGPELALRAIEAGAEERNAVAEHAHNPTTGDSFRMLQGMVVDPFGHYWLIGKFLD